MPNLKIATKVQNGLKFVNLHRPTLQGRAANESKTKLQTFNKKLSFKTATGRRVPLTDLLAK